MRALLWKDYRINRPLLIFAVVFLVGPFVAILAANSFALLRYEVLAWSWGDAFVLTGSFGLPLHLLTMAMLGGNAIACERVDRSAEFLAYLPASRRAILASKATIAIGACIVIWLVELGIAYGLASAAGGVSEHTIDFRDTVVPVFATSSVLLFGAGWLASSFMSSHALATGVGIAAPIALLSVLAGVAYLYDLQGFDTGLWYKTASIPLGVLCFAAGIICYLRRIEP